MNKFSDILGIDIPEGTKILSATNSTQKTKKDSIFFGLQGSKIHGSNYAEEALNLGLTNWVVSPEELEQKTKEIAEQLAAGPSVAYRYMKENLNRAMSGEVDDCLDLEATHHVHCGETIDHKNAVKAFVEKKKPEFQGK